MSSGVPRIYLSNLAFGIFTVEEEKKNTEYGIIQ